VALWNDHDDWELEFEFAMNDIRLESSNSIRELPATLLFSVFGSASLYVRRRQRFYAEPFQQLSEPYVTWIEDLKKYEVGRTPHRQDVTFVLTSQCIQKRAAHRRLFQLLTARHEGNCLVRCREQDTRSSAPTTVDFS
jgi:hypothetical protein